MDIENNNAHIFWCTSSKKMQQFQVTHCYLLDASTLFPWGNLTLSYLERQLSGRNSTARGWNDWTPWGLDSKHKQWHLFSWVMMKPFANGTCVHPLVCVSHKVTLMLIVLNAEPKVRKQKDILLSWPLWEFRGLCGVIKPPFNFSSHIKEYKGVVWYLKVLNYLNYFGVVSHSLYIQLACSSLT